MELSGNNWLTERGSNRNCPKGYREHDRKNKKQKQRFSVL